MNETISPLPAPEAQELCLLELQEDGVAHLRLNRPKASNGLSLEMLRALQQTVLRVHGDGRIRALLVSGEGRHFCAGDDVHVFRAQGEALPDYIRLGAIATQLARHASTQDGKRKTLQQSTAILLGSHLARAQSDRLPRSSARALSATTCCTCRLAHQTSDPGRWCWRCTVWIARAVQQWRCMDAGFGEPWM